MDAGTTTRDDAGGARLPMLDSLREDLGPKLAGSVLPFALVLYLALRGGGYDAVVRGEVGVAVSWIVLLGALLGVLPSARLSRGGWAALLLLVAFAAWTGLSATWSESSERSVAELARVATYVVVFALALSAQSKDGLRRAVGAVAAALALVAALALMSRLHPSWFPADEIGEVIGEARARLRYPLDYWNALAALMAIALPLLLTVAAASRRIVSQALATAAVPVIVLTAYYSLSRGGVVEFAIALLAFLILSPRRAAALPGLALGGAGAIVLVLAARQRDALADGLSSQLALDQGDQMLILTLIVCLCAGLAGGAVGLAARRELLPRPHVSRKATAVAAVGTALILAVVFLAVGGPSELSDRWEEFKQPIATETNASSQRIESLSGNGRYQFWQAALDANSTEPVAGLGAGTYEYFWAREGELPGFVRDAHSLYLEALGELGVVGLLLLVALSLVIVVVGVRRAIDLGAPDRPWAAAATAACIAFVAAAAIDWVWELAVLPVVFLFLAAALLAPREAHDGSTERDPRARWAIAAIAAVSMLCIALPLAGTSFLRASQSEARALELDSALTSAETAETIQPYAAAPSLQQALVYELRGDFDAAATQAQDATEAEPTNWRTWLVLARIEAYRGNSNAAVEAYRAARSLNPRSPLFTR